MANANKRVLIINTFPIVKPMSGGQKRQAAIVEAYAKAFDKVRYVSVFFKEHHKQYSQWDIPLPDELTETMRRSPHTGDIVCGKAIYDNPTVKGRMAALLKDFRPDIIQIEQAFPYFGLKPLLEEMGLKPTLVYSSHNVEAPHKAEILRSTGMTEAEVKPVIKELKAVELDLVKEAGLVIACTETDRKFFAEHGAKKTVVARNGMAPIQATESELSYWRDYFAERGIAKKVLFVGAAHPPNWVGFEDMVGYGIGFLPFDARLFMIGGICDYFENNIREEYNPVHLTFWQRVIACGRLSEDRMNALISLADVIVLPITEGGGSNLKTAEAVLANKAVVATSHAFRSFEELKSLPNIYIADTKPAFQAAVAKALREPLKARTAGQEALAESVLWKNCLKDAVKEVTKL